MGGPDPFGWLGATIEGQFAVEAIAGEGAFGVVYRGTHLGFEAPIAIKCLKLPADLSEEQRRAFLATFRSEARLLHRLSRRTTGIVQALDVGVASSPKGIWTPYTVMEWLDGETLDAELRRRRDGGAPPRDLGQAMALLRPAALALAIAHEENVSHRDIKPQNLFLAVSRGGPMLKVLDFGIAKVFAETPTLAEALTQTGQGFHAFTPQYAAPEQFSPRFGATGPWTDVFAFALLLVEVVTGRAALRGNDVMQLYVASADEHERPVPSARGVPLPPAVEAVLARALAVSPAARYRDIGELWAALEGAAGGVEVTMLAAQVEQAPAPRPASRPPPPRTAPPGTARTHGDGENRVCTVMFVDLSALARLADRLPAEQVRDILEQSTSAVAESVASMGGFLDRAAGDRLMAVFGVPRAGDHDAERAVHAALRAQQRLAELPLPRAAREARGAVRVGIESGRVFAGPVGTRQEVTVIGEAVNVAARMLAGAPPGSVVVGRSSHRQLGKVFALEPLAPPGAGDPRESGGASLWRVIGPATSSALPPDDFLGVETRLCGRAAERRALLDALEGALGDARAGLVTVVGPPGAGRSRLLADFMHGLSAQSELYVAMAAQCSPLTRDQGYGLIAALLRRWFRIHEGDSVAAARERLAFGVRWFQNAQAAGETGGLLGEAPDGGDTGRGALDADDEGGELDDCLDRLAELVTGVVPRPPGDSVPRDDSALAARARTAAAVAQLLSALAAHAPLVLVCDDVHWADEASLELLDDVVGRLGDVPVLLACSARPELFERRPQWGEGAPWAQRIDLGPLPRRTIEEMVRDRLQRVAELDPEVVRVLAERAEGNPLTLVECLHLLVEAGIVETAGAAWLVHADRLGALELPATVQGLVQARLDRLDEGTRGVVGRAAVVGRSFWEGALEALVDSWRREAEAERAPPPPERDTAAEVAELRQRQLVRAREPSSIEGQRELGFAEAAIQEVAYETLSIRVRRPAHILTAQWLERHAQGAGLGPRLAFHLDRGGDLARAATEYARAGAAAAALGQNHEALRHYQRAQEIHDASDAEGGAEQSGLLGTGGGASSGDAIPTQRVAGWRERVALRLERGDVLRRIGRPDEAATAYAEARARVLAAERRSDEALAPGETERWQARVDFRLALLEKLSGHIAEARVLAESAITRARAAGAEGDTPPMYALLVFLHRRARDPDASWAAALEGLRISRRTRARGRGDPLAASAEGPRPAPGPRWREDVAELLFGLAAALYAKQRMVAAERTYAQARRVLGDPGDPRLAGIALNGMAAARLARGDLPGARETFRRALRLKERAGDLHQIAVGCANLADVELKLGNAAAALEHAQRSVRLGEQSRAGSDLPAMQHNLAEAALASGRLELALEAATRALGLAEASARLYLGEVASTLARIIVAAARQPSLDEPARAAEARLRRSFEEHFEADDLRARADECRALLDASHSERTRP